MKKIILSFMIVFASLPVFAFKEGDVLLYPSIALGYSILTNVESSRDDSVAVGYDANIAINGEFFILDELSISAGFGTEIKHSYTSIDADYETDWDTFDLIIKEKFLIIPVIARYHVLLSDDATLFFGAGMQYNKCISSEYEASSYALTEDISGKFKKTDEKWVSSKSVFMQKLMMFFSVADCVPSTEQKIKNCPDRLLLKSEKTFLDRQ